MRLKRNRGIKVGENHDETEVHRPIDPLIGEARNDRTRDTREPRDSAVGEEGSDHLRKEENRKRKDDGHDPCLVDSKWQIGGDAAHYAHPSYAPSIGNWNWPLCLG